MHPYPIDGSFKATRPKSPTWGKKENNWRQAEFYPIMEIRDEGAEVSLFNNLLCDTISTLVEYIRQNTNRVETFKQQLSNVSSID